MHNTLHDLCKPVRRHGHDHEWPEALCLSRTHCANASEETIGEFYEGAIALINAGIPQPAFFLARQLAELSLKAFVGPGQKDGHDLGKLLKRLQESGDDLFSANDDRRLVVEFIRNLHARDPRGDQGRYATTKGGDLSPPIPGSDSVVSARRSEAQSSTASASN